MSSPNGTSATERFTAQRNAAGLTDDPMWFVYVLELKPDNEGVSKFYVGHTCRLQRRVHDHMMNKTVGWVRRWGVSSVIQCIRTTEESALGLEVAKTTELKAKHGWQNVRGGGRQQPTGFTRSPILGSASSRPLPTSGAFTKPEWSSSL